MHPIVVLTIDGRPVSNLFMQQLISVSITDKEGTRADTIDITLDGEGISLPRKKAIITAAIGYRETGVAGFGSYTADDATLHVLPRTIQIQGKSADMREGLKEHKERHWDDKDFKGVAGEIAKENGLQLQISSRIGAFKGRDGYFNQGGESGLHFIERMARRLDGLFAIKDGKLIIADKGSGLTAAGAAMSGLIVTAPMILQGSCSVKFSQREKHKKVRAAYHDTGEAKRKYEEAPSDPEAKAAYTLRHQYGSKDEAKRAASAKAKELQREADTTSVTIEGNIAARGGAPMSYAEVDPEIDGLPWIIETATHTFNKGGAYQTAISAKAKK